MISQETASVGYRMLVSVRGGLHRGAVYVAEANQSILIGKSPDCDLVLMDVGVQAQSLRGRAAG